MTPRDLLTKISSGKFGSTYYFFGNEDYRIVEAEKFLAKKFLTEDQLRTNYRRFNSRKTKANDLVAELSVYPMLGERQVFAVTEFQNYKPTEIKKILALLDPPDPNRIIIFSSPSARMPKKKSAFLNNMARIAQTVEFNKLRADESRAAIVTKFRRAGLTIEPKALARLIEQLDGNRGALDSEVEKLINFKTANGEAGEISTDDIGLVTAGYEVYSVFELAELVVQPDLAKALKLIDRLLAEGNSATGLVYQLGIHFLSLYKVKNGQSLEVHRRFLERKFRPQAAKYPAGRLEEIIIEVAQADANLRRAGLEPRLELEALLVKLVSPSG